MPHNGVKSFLKKIFLFVLTCTVSMYFFNISILFFSECFIFISKKRLKEWSFRKNANQLCTLMEPFGLGHVVNERFALEVRKVHGQGREGRIRNWAKKIMKSKLQFYPAKICEKNLWIREKFSKSFICYRLLRLEITQNKSSNLTS